MVSLDDILKRGQGPVAPTFMDGAMGASAPASAEAAGAAPAEAETERTGVENVSVPIESVQASPESKKLSYVDMYQQLSPYKPPTAEELEKERKKQRRDKTFAAIGDGLAAMSNLFFTTQYAPNAYDPRESLSEKARARWDMLIREREGKQREYMNGLMRAMQMDADAGDKDRAWRHMLDREHISDERYAERAAQDKALAELNLNLKGYQADRAEQEAEIARVKAGHAEEDAILRTEGLRAGIVQKRAAAEASNARANHYRNGGGSRKGPTLQLEADEPMRFENDKDYDRAVMRLAPEYGVKTTMVEVTERYEHGSKKGQPKKQKTIQRPVKDIAADIEREAAKRRPVSLLPDDDFSSYRVLKGIDFSQYKL